MDGFVGQRAAPAHDADVALLVNAPRHDPDFAFPRRDHTWTIRPDQARLLKVDCGGHAHHVDDRHAFRDANDERHFGVGGFQDGVRGVRRRNKNHGRIRPSGLHRFRHRIKNGTLQMLCAAFARGHATHHVGAILNHLLRVEGAFTTREALDDEARFFVYQHAHRAPPARATTFCAPSFMPSAMVKFKPESRRICWPTSTLVPSIRTTTGTLTPRSFAAATTPVARTSQRRMPPKILMNTARTLVSLIRMRNAFFTCSAEAPPPTSRKFAGEPPAYLMISMVAIAKPAPLTMQATLPSSLM